MTKYLTDNEKKECEQIANAIVDMNLQKIQDRMRKHGYSFETALEIILRDMQK